MDNDIIILEQLFTENKSVCIFNLNLYLLIFNR